MWGQPFKDEIHSRLRFAVRGLVAMANGGKDDNGSQFFLTLGVCEWLPLAMDAALMQFRQRSADDHLSRTHLARYPSSCGPRSRTLSILTLE